MRPYSAIHQPLHQFLLSQRTQSLRAISKASSVRPLQYAVARGRADVVSWFLSKGADVQKRDSDGVTLLHTAVDHGHINIVSLLLDHGADVNGTDLKGRTPMHLIPAGRSDIINLLVDLGSRVDIKDDNGNSALMLAAFQGQPERVKTYLRQGADVNAAEPIPALINGMGDAVLPPILVAIQQQHAGVLEVLLEQGADLRPRFPESGQTVLHHAVTTHNHEAVRCLILFKMDLEVRDATGYTVLHNVAFQGSEAHSGILLELLLSAGANIEAKTPSGHTALYIAAKEGALGATQRLLDAGANIATRTNCHRTPLHIAARQSHLEIVQSLLDEGAAVNVRDENGETPLHLACFNRGNKSLSVVKYLLGRGASVLEAADPDKAEGRLPPHQAAIAGFKEAVELFLDEGFDKNNDAGGLQMIHYAARSGHVDVLKLLLDRGTRPGSSTRIKGCRPIHFAAYEGHVEIISVLCEFGADVNVESWKGGFYPIHYAAASGHTEVISLLQKKGAKIDALNDDRHTALVIAVYNGKTQCVSLLCDYGASVNRGGQPLFEAASLGHVDIVSILCQRGANVHTEWDAGYTPLFEAASKGHTKVVQVLLDHNANVDVQTSIGGQTPLHVAASIGHKELVDLLLERGANPELMTAFKETALALAQEYGHDDVCKILETARKEQKSGAINQASDSSGHSMKVEAPRKAKVKK